MGTFKPRVAKSDNSKSMPCPNDTHTMFAKRGRVWVAPATPTRPLNYFQESGPIVVGKYPHLNVACCFVRLDDAPAPGAEESGDFAITVWQRDGTQKKEKLHDRNCVGHGRYAIYRGDYSIQNTTYTLKLVLSGPLLPPAHGETATEYYSD